MTTGTVSSSNLTSLYSNTTSFTAGVVNSSVYSVNGGTGVTVNPTTGNVVVNIGQDVSTSASVTFANLTATGNLSNNYYTLTNSTGIAGQVLTTNGLGVTTWTTPSSLGLVSSVSGTGAGISVSPTTGAVVVSNTGVTSIVAGSNISISGATGAVTVNATGTTYTINAGTTTGGANLNLVGSDLTTDSIKFASGSGITVSRTDANTITITNATPGGTGVTSITGTANQVIASSSTGAVTLSLPQSIATTSSVSFGGLNVDSGTLFVDPTNNRVGVNTTAPLQELTVNAGGDGYCQIGMENTERTWLVTNNDGDDLISYSVVIPSPFSVVNRLQFDATGGNQWFNSGRLGVANSSPTEALDVTGNGKFSGTISTEGVLVNLTTPVHQGQLLYVSDDVTPTITNSNLIPWSNATYRPNFQGDSGTYGRTQTGAQVSNNTGAVNYTTGDGSGVLVSVDSDGQSSAAIGTFTVAYDTTGNHEVRLSTSTNNFANDLATSIITSNTLVFPVVHGFAVGDKLTYSGPTQNGLTYNTTYYVIAAGFTTTQCQVSLTLGGSAVALTNGTGLSLYFFNGSQRLFTATSNSVDLFASTILLNATNTGIPFTGLAGIEIERGTTGVNQTFAWDETYDFWRASSNLYADDYVIGGNGLATNGNNIYYNNENISPAGTSNLIVKSGVSAGVDANFRWNDSTKRWQDTIDGTNYFNLPNQNLDTTSDVSFSSVTIDSQAALDTSTITTTQNTTAVPLNTTGKNAMTGLINIIQGSNVHCLNYTVLRVDATTALLTTYAEMYNTTSLGSFTADVSGGILRLLVTPTSASSTVFSVVRTSLT